MLEVQIPGKKTRKIAYVLSDINGTLCLDGQLLDGVAEAVAQLKSVVEFYLLSADTYGTAAEIARQLGVELHVIEVGNEARQKEKFLKKLGAKQTVAIGQGANDELMLKKAALSICVLSHEGSAVQTLNAADLVVPDILSALELLQKPTRIVASLRK
jgi:P-type E1-E2 ATPase